VDGWNAKFPQKFPRFRQIYLCSRSDGRRDRRAQMIKVTALEETMLRKLMIGTIAGAVLALAPSAFAQGVGTAAEAKAMIEKAVTELKANEAAALAKFNKADGGFRDRDL